MSKNAKQILDGLGDRDPDLREMACRDLEKGLLNDLKLTATEEQQLANRFLEMIAKDQTLKVLASHTMVDMLKQSATPTNVASAATQSVQHLLGKHPEDEKTIREVSTYALKGLITASVQPSFTPSLIHGPLLGALKENKKEVTEYVLDVLETLLVHWGKYLVDEPNGEQVYEAIQLVALPHLGSSNYNIQTKAIGCVGNVGAFLSYNAFDKLIAHLIDNLKTVSAKADCSNACTTLSSLSTICRLSPARFSKFLRDVVPLVGIFVQAEEFTDESEQVKVCEAALTTLETIVSYCNRSSTEPFFAIIQEQALQFIAYDPTVIEGADYGDDEGGETEDFDYEDDGGVDESESWRVRKACIKCIHAIASKSDAKQFGDMFDVVAEELIKRFTDSQVNVKIEIFKTFSNIVGLVKSSPDESLLVRFNEWIPTIVIGLTKEFKSKGDKSKIEAFSLVQEIAAASTGAFDEHLPKLIPGIVSSLKDSSENLRTEVSKALRSLILHSSKPAAFHQHIKSLVPALITAIGTSNFKVTAAALRAATQIAKILPDKESVDQLYTTTYNILTHDNAALEVKESAMGCSGQLIASHADKLGSKVNDCVKAIGDRLGHATTGVAASKAIQTIASSSLRISFGDLSKTISHQLLESLKLNNRQLRQSALEALTVFVPSTGVKLEGFDVLVAYIEPEDLLITGLSLRLVTAAIKTNAAVVSDVVKHVIPKCFTVLKSPTFQGGAVASMGIAFKAVVDAKPDQFDALFSSLLNMVGSEASSQVNSVAQVIGAIVEGSPQREEVVKKFLGEAKAGRPLAISALGEIGSRTDISTVAGAVDIVIGALGSSLTSSAGSSDKSVRFTAARALGSIIVGNPSKGISILEKQITKTPSYTVVAIRQLIDRLSHEALISSTESFLKLLIEASEKADEVVRDSIADCIGKLAQVNPDVVGKLEKSSKCDSKSTRACVIKAISLAINQSNDYKTFATSLPTFLDGIEDKEVEVRTAALGLLQTCISKNVSLVKHFLPKYVSMLAVEAKRRPELITKVTVGANILVTDLGLPSRRTTFQILDALLTAAPENLDLSGIITSLAGGVKSDEEVEIQMLCHKITVKLASQYPEAYIIGIGSFDLSPVFIKLLPNTAIDVDIKANEELVNSAKTLIHTAEDILYSNKYLNKTDTYVYLEALIKAGFGALRCGKLYKQAIIGLSDSATQEATVKLLTELWKNFDTKLQNNLGHKAIAEEVMSGLEELLPSFKNLPESKNDAYVKAALAWIRVVDVAFARLERHKKDMKVNPHNGFNNFLNNTIKKGSLASKYADLCK